MKSRRTVGLIALLSLLGLGACGDPTGLQDEQEGEGGSNLYESRNFAHLINNFRQGKRTPTPWAGWWWSYGGNGIANGSYGGGKSPAGKYDAVRGRRNQAQDWEVHHHGAKVPGVQGWWGHCNGWTAAAALFPEPRDEIRVNGVSFSVADRKALLSEAAMEVNADFFGDRVDPWDYSDWKVNDTVPAQFFLVLTNFMGKKNHPVLVDRFTTGEVWNQPLAAYRFDMPKPADYLGEHPQVPGVYRINMNARIWWMSDNVGANHLTLPFNWEESLDVDSRALKFELWLDAPVVFEGDKIKSSGNIVVTRDQNNPNKVIGGKWAGSATSDAWPDYMWVPHSVFERDADAPNDDPYRNPFIDPAWTAQYMVNGGNDGSTPIDIPDAPTPEPSPSVTSSPGPRPTSTARPTPRPTRPN
jgi:hypothetical protein